MIEVLVIGFLASLVLGAIFPDSKETKKYEHRTFKPINKKFITEIKDYRFRSMRRITRPGIDPNKLEVILEEHGEEEKPVVATVIRGGPPEVIPFSIDGPVDYFKGEVFRFYLDSPHGRYAENGKVMYFLSRNQAKKKRNKLHGQWFVNELTSEELSRHIPSTMV